MSTFMLGRRDFLKAAAAGGFVLTPVAQLYPRQLTT